MNTEAVHSLHGIGPKAAKDLESLGIRTVGDLVLCYPLRYEYLPPLTRIRDAVPGERIAVRATVDSAPFTRGYGKNTTVSFTLRDESGSLRVAFFHMPFLAGSLKKGTERVFWGKVTEGSRGLWMEHPTLFEPETYASLAGSIRPVYPLAGSLTQAKMRGAVRQALNRMDEPEAAVPRRYLPAGALEGREALWQLHFPDSAQLLRRARESLIFEEFLVYLLRLRAEKSAPRRAGCRMPEGAREQALTEGLPYALTQAQQRVRAEIDADLASGRPMNRLLQGDVGSGKTVLALLALVRAWENGWQGALMAPTEVLARQHYEKITALLQAYPIRTALLVGSLKEKEKQEIHRQIAAGEVDLVIGTHALLQESVAFARLGLVVTDEQHRFGVRQRETLTGKGGLPSSVENAGTQGEGSALAAPPEPHLLVMSATPIPRTLAIILYGDLDVSVLDELPKGRVPIENAVITPRQRGAAYRLIMAQAAEGHQSFVICPFIEKSEAVDGENVVDYTEMIRKIFPETVKIEALNGRMKAAEKNAVMERFVRGETQVLVSTTVIEVGVDVPNATVMMVENAERFGLAQLHQLRGRVGRGSSRSFALFVDGSGRKEKNKRLEVLAASNDGFQIAEEDLKLRGPGDLFGTRQSGELQLGLGNVIEDHELLLKASETAGVILQEAPGLDGEEFAALRRRVESVKLSL